MFVRGAFLHGRFFRSRGLLPLLRLGFFHGLRNRRFGGWFFDRRFGLFLDYGFLLFLFRLGLDRGLWRFLFGYLNFRFLHFGFLDRRLRRRFLLHGFEFRRLGFGRQNLGSRRRGWRRRNFGSRGHRFRWPRFSRGGDRGGRDQRHGIGVRRQRRGMARLAVRVQHAQHADVDESRQQDHPAEPHLFRPLVVRSDLRAHDGSGAGRSAGVAAGASSRGGNGSVTMPSLTIPAFRMAAMTSTTLPYTTSLSARR